MNEDGGHWYFRELNWEEYQIQFTYRNEREKVEFSKKSASLWLKQGGEPVLEGLWTGTVSTPFVFFDLVSATES